MKSTKPLVLVDGSSYLFRAFHALPPLTNAHGEPTGAMHGVLNMLDKLRKDYDPEHMAVIFDAPGKTFRDDLYPQYKANRPPMPDDLRCQIEPLLAIIRAQGYPLLIIPDVEADDVIGTLAAQYDGKVIISTGDKDMAQLVDERVHLINTMSGHYADPAGVVEKFGVAPERIRDYLTLIGDTVDNVPGVNKVGPKTAVKWLDEYGSLENIMARADEFKGKIGENLREALAHLPLSFELVTIKCDVELDLQPETLAFDPPDVETLRAMYERYGFRTRLAALAATPVTPHPNPAPSPLQGRPSRGEGLEELPLSFSPSPLEGEGAGGVRGSFKTTKVLFAYAFLHTHGCRRRVAASARCRPDHSAGNTCGIRRC